MSFPSALSALCVLCLMGILTLVDIFDGPGTERQEREARTPRSITSVGTLPGFVSDVRYYVGKRYALKDQFVSWNGRVKLGLFGHSPAPNVQVGQDDFLFLVTDDTRSITQGQKRMDATERADWSAYFAQLQRIFMAQGTPFFLVIGPNKLSIYPDKVLGGMEIADLSQTRTMDVLKAARAAGFESIIDTRQILRKTREIDPYTYLFHPTDTHWTEWGAALALHTVFERSGLSLPPPQYTITQMPHSGDLARMVGQQQNWGAQAPVLPNNWSCKHITGEPLPVVTIDPLMPREFTCGTPTGRADRVVVFMDSFGVSAIPYLAARFKEVSFIWTDTVDPTRTAKADLVLQILVERKLVTQNPSRFLASD